MLCTWTANQPCRLVIKSSDGSSIESTQQNSSHEISHFLKSKVTVSIEPIQVNRDGNELNIPDLDHTNLKPLKRKLAARNRERLSIDENSEDSAIGNSIKRRKSKKHLEISVTGNLVDDDGDSNLILDVHSKTNKVRVQVNDVIAKELKPHQVEGIKFMYNSTIGDVDKLKNEEGSGCILAHCMGLGKSLQVITFVHTLLTSIYTRQYIRNILITVPVNALKNWAAEFDKWITSRELKTFKVHEIVNDVSLEKRVERLERWKRKGGILIIGHSLLGNLVNLLDGKATKGTSIALTTIEEVFCDPGPDIVIIDEGHRLKNPSTRISKAVARMRTKRKIILTGTPLQNNLEEFHIMSNIIKPHLNLKGSKKEFENLIRNQIGNGQQTDADENDCLIVRQKSTVLHQMFSSCIQRFDFQTLEKFIQPKLEYAIFIRPTKLMAQMYNFYLDQVQRDKLLWNANSLRLCVNHPALYRLQKEREAAKQEAAAIRKQGRSKKSSLSEDTSDDSSESEIDEPDDSRLNKDWYQQFVDSDDWKNIELSGKFILLFKILKSCLALGDKLLVVSQSLETLDLIERCLKYYKRIQIGDHEEKIKWKLYKNYFRIDGGTNPKDRYDQMLQFNDTENMDARLFLLSTKAGGIGIDLTGANRVIVFDVSWNPSDDTQAIFRVYRLGQTKPVYVYRFIAKDSMEEQIFRKQIVKLGMSIQLINKQLGKRTFKASELDEFYASRPKENYYSTSLPSVPKDRLLANILLSNNKEVLECTELDVLLEKKAEKELTEEERQAAWNEYQRKCKTEILQVELEKEQEEQLYAVLREEQMRNISENEQNEKSEESIQVNQVEEEEAVEDLKPSTSFLLESLTTSSPNSSETSTLTRPETPAQPSGSPLKPTEPTSPPQPKVSTPKPSSSFPSSFVPLSFSTEDCKELDDAFVIRPKSAPLDTVVSLEKTAVVKTDELNKPSAHQNLFPENLNRMIKEEVPPPVIIKREVEPEELKKIEVTSKKSSTNENTQKSSSDNKIQSNWLDISQVPIESVLIVTATRNGFYQDGHTTAMAFRSIYDEFGRYKREIKGIKHEEGYIRIYTNHQFRSKIKRELDEINESRRLDHKLIPDVKYPIIKFEWDQEIVPQNQKEMLERIKKWNRWQGSVIWTGSKWSATAGKYRTTLSVSSRIRDDIEKGGGIILLGRDQVSVVDEFNIIQCFRCSEYGHMAFTCKNYRRCGFCGRGHRSDCKVRDTSKWKCCLCRVKGHSAFSKHCPILIDYLRPKLEEIDHKYNYIFLDYDRKC